MTQFLAVNYDTVAANYNRRMQGTYLQDITPALQVLARRVRAQRVLDIGCGTGRSLHGVAEGAHPPAVAYGVDFSAGMLAQARRFDPAYRLAQGEAARLPFAPNSLDLIFCVHAFHHFPDKAGVVEAAFKTLRPGGAFAIVNVDLHACRPGDWWIYDYFEGTQETDRQRFPTRAAQEALLRRAGFQDVSSPVVQYIEENVTGEEIFKSYWLRKNSCSQLILLSDAVYQAGLQRIHDRLASAKAMGETVVFRAKFENLMCHGFKPH